MRADIDLKYFRNTLEQRRKTILSLKDGRQEASRAVELDQARVGRLSRMDALQQQEMAKASNRRAALELKQIESALSRMRAGEYGYCVQCREDIAEARLRSEPSVLTCITCARMAEER